MPTWVSAPAVLIPMGCPLIPPQLPLPTPPSHFLPLPAKARTRSTASRGASTSKTWPLSSTSTCHRRSSPTSTAWAGPGGLGAPGGGVGAAFWGCLGRCPTAAPLRARRTARADNPGTALTFVLPEERDRLAQIEDRLAGGRGGLCHRGVGGTGCQGTSWGCPRGRQGHGSVPRERPRVCPQRMAGPCCSPTSSAWRRSRACGTAAG